MGECNLCPRHCNVNRDMGVGVCGMHTLPKVAKAYLHMWEEPCISGNGGSGTIFFSGCNLKCAFCQNYQISHEGFGKEISIARLAEIFQELEGAGAENINLVSPSHYAFAIKEALDIYRPSVPIVYNCGGYESLDSLEILKDYIDIYLVDFKYMSGDLAFELSSARDYPEVVKRAISRMREYQPEDIFDGEILKKGLIVRHLILPGHTDDSIEVLKWLKDALGNPIISLMGQYTPMYKAKEIEGLNRPLKPIEYKVVERKMEELGLDNGYVQELSSACDTYTPIWDLQGVEKRNN